MPLRLGRFGQSRFCNSIPRFCPGDDRRSLSQGVLHPECTRIFRIDKTDSDHMGKELLLHEHQRQAILKAKRGKILCTDQWHRIRQKPYLHRANRGPRLTEWVGTGDSGDCCLPNERTRQQPVRGTKQVS